MDNCTFSADIVKCFNCGFIQTEPVSATTLAHYYSTDYREKWTEQTFHSMRTQSRHQAEAQVAFLEEMLEAQHFEKVLDYGAADGELLRMLRPKCRSLYATEQDPLYANQLKDEPWLTLLNEKELHDEQYQGTFDLITISHVLEHLPDPSAILCTFAIMLAPGGILLIDVPHELELLKCGGHGSGHLQFFTAEHLRILVNRDGFYDLLEIRRCNRSIGDFISSNFTLPEDHSIANNKNGTTIRALFRNRNHGHKTPPNSAV